MYYNNNGGYAPAKPDNNLVWAILCTVMCCVPAGIYAIVKANQVDNLYHQGLYEEAEKAASDAKKWSIIGAVASFVFVALYLIFYFFVVVMAAAAGSY